jgi:arginyl-tRNA synthetase
MKKRLDALLQHAILSAVKGGVLKLDGLPPSFLEIPRDAQYGDLASTVALQLARPARQSPRAIAEAVVAHLEDPEGLIAETTIAGPGYLNFRFSARFWRECLADIEAPNYGRCRLGDERRVLIEFVSANPTGPLTIGHGRNAVLGDAIARLLEAAGYQLSREYYFNNAGRQMMLLGQSVRARYLELLGDAVAFPEEGYQGEYIVDIARQLHTEHGDRLRDEPATGRFKEAAERAIFTDIEATLSRLGIVFDTYFNEDTLYTGGQIAAILDELRGAGLAFDHDGAVWLRGEPLGLGKDRVLVKSSGEPAYRLPDIAYHKEKLARGFDLIIDVLGADHIAEHEEVRSAVRALGLDAEKIKAIIYQFVTLTRAGAQVKMSTRRAEYVTVDELLDEVGVDATRFFFLMRKSDSHLDFDLDLAKKQSADNPVFYVQYAHARIASLFRQAAGEGVAVPRAGEVALEKLTDASEQELVKLLAQYPDVVEDGTRELEPHRIVFFLLEIAGSFHRFYNRQRVLGVDPELRDARLYLAWATQRTVRAGLTLLGISAPESM